MNNEEARKIDLLSVVSLYLEPQVNNNILGSATGFVVQYGQMPYLITNWHVVSGRNPNSGKLLSPETGATPDSIRIFHHTAKLGEWIITSEALYDSDGNPRWIEHKLGRKIDVVALPLSELDKVKLYPLDLRLAESKIIPQPGMPASIIGYPFGLSNFLWPIWKTGHIASDPDVDFDGCPIFLIDATTRSGMSGSPVVLRLTHTYYSNNVQGLVSEGVTTKFLGVYSGRIHNEAEIGKVWKPKVISEILTGAKYRLT
ncbi:hypothetical protein Tfer_2753 [Thermincola ferriacetica]|uniref:Serine protease n=1 Tax=Thermincola ferriacetica TaxID=281456 RepID=A0A0L6VZA7_9FIRM|nr:trypsin-like peptidase domain-containing protein [Thermincola ferriacetica]KNZ68662.1 hypothetical protein Tfer_2753 [Thermincola ferriacetica]